MLIDIAGGRILYVVDFYEGFVGMDLLDVEALRALRLNEIAVGCLRYGTQCPCIKVIVGLNKLAW